MKKAILLLILILTINNVQALATSNLSIDGIGLEICISQNLTYQICNSTETLILDGTTDHILYLMPKIEIENDATNIQLFTWGMFNTMNLILSIGVVLIALMSGFIIIMLFKNVFKH